MLDHDLLRVENLRTTFVTPSGEVTVVDGASLRVAAGESVGIVGESGSGKSVFTRSILGLQSRKATVHADLIEFQGQSLLGMRASERRNLLGARIGVVLQDPFLALNPVVKIGRHFTEALRRHLKLSKRDARERSIELMRQVGIPSADKRFDAYPHALSGGMRQRVCIALGISCGPALLVADEPTTALDVTTPDRLSRSGQQRRFCAHRITGTPQHCLMRSLVSTASEVNGCAPSRVARRRLPRLLQWDVASRPVAHSPKKFVANRLRH